MYIEGTLQNSLCTLLVLPFTPLAQRGVGRGWERGTQMIEKYEMMCMKCMIDLFMISSRGQVVANIYYRCKGSLTPH